MRGSSGQIAQQQLPAAVQAQVPSAVVEGLTLYGYGNSYLAVSSAIAQRRYFERLAGRLHAGASFNDGAAGWLAVDCANFAHNTQSYTIGRGSATGTWNPAALVGGIVLLELVRNDAGWDGLASGQYRAGFTNALDSLIRLLRSAASTQDTNAAFAYTGTWTAQTLATLPGGSGHYTSTNGDHVTITVPNVAAATDWSVIVLGFDTTLTGAAFKVTVDGVDITAGLPTSTTAGQLKQGKVTTANWVPVAVPLGTLAGGSTHTVVITHNDTTGRYLYVHRLLQASPTPPTILIPKAAQLPSGGYGSYTAAGASWATDQVYNGLVDTVAGRFGGLSALGPAGRALADLSIVTWDPNLDGWQTGYISGADLQQIHPGDQGMGFYADRLMGVLNQLGYRLGQNTV